MELFALHLIALGLAMDAFAVSVSNGICYKGMGIKEALFMAFTFGAFQAVMPLLGYLAGSTVSHAVEFIDHWIALFLLGFIGGTLIYNGIKGIRHPKEDACKDCCTFLDLILQGIATSIDAFAIGISFAVIRTNVYLAVSLIGTDTFICCLLGFYLGKRFGGGLREKAEIIGGAVLIFIGIKIFVEHIFYKI
jgi:putative Mn2+ efflux pump MntP